MSDCTNVNGHCWHPTRSGMGHLITAPHKDEVCCWCHATLCVNGRYVQRSGHGPYDTEKNVEWMEPHG